MVCQAVELPKNTVVDGKPVYGRSFRKQLSQTLKLADVSLGVDRRKISNRSLMDGGASLMFEVGFEMESIKRRGRWISTTFHQYLRRGEPAMSGISRGTMSKYQNHGRSDGERTRYDSTSERNAHRRSIEISKMHVCRPEARSFARHDERSVVTHRDGAQLGRSGKEAIHF